MSNDVVLEPEVRNERFMRSDAARKNRKVVKSIVEKKMRKEMHENEKLVEKHNTLINSKKKKRKDDVST